MTRTTRTAAAAAAEEPVAGIRLKFVGTMTTQFPTILTDTGSLVVEPGDVIVLDTDPGHPDLIPMPGKSVETDQHATLLDVASPTPTED